MVMPQEQRHLLYLSIGPNLLSYHTLHVRFTMDPQGRRWRSGKFPFRPIGRHLQ